MNWARRKQRLENEVFTLCLFLALVWYIYGQRGDNRQAQHKGDKTMTAYLNELIAGKTVRAVIMDTEGFPILVCTDGSRIRVCADSGENAPGFLRVG